MKRLNESRYWIAGIVLAISFAYLLDIWITKQPTVFNKAQDSTVIVKSPSGASGSGSVIRRVNRDGSARMFVWTAAHVVDDGNTFGIESRVRNEFRKVGSVTFKARVIFRAPSEDIALLALDAPDGFFRYAKFDDVEQRPIGSEVFHVGNFFGADAFDDSVSWGRISQIGVRPDAGWDWKSIDQADMVIIPGSSGGPLFSSESNKILGIVVGWPRMPGINFYVPLRTIRKVSPEWAIYGDDCPSDQWLDKAAESCKIVVKKNEPVPTNKPEPEPESKKKVEPKKALRRFTFRGW